MDFSEVIINWYNKNKRDLPWRNTSEPYYIWLSEIILQQTRVDQGYSYYTKFVNQYPIITDLAAASEDEVLKLWQGLGYYSRARNLHFTAKQIVDKYFSVFPATYNELKKLKGVGDYTAAAIASFAYNEAVPVVDGNVYRVLSRVYDVDLPIDSTLGKKYFWSLASELLNKKDPAIHNQAIMEFGALVCTPQPKCDLCPMLEICLSYKNKNISNRPVKSKKLKQKTRYFNYYFVSGDGKAYLEKRTGKDIWENLYQFPLFESDEDLETLDDQNLPSDWALKKVTILPKHILTHQIIYAKVWEFNAKELVDAKYLTVQLDQLEDFAVPRLIENYIQLLRQRFN